MAYRQAGRHINLERPQSEHFHQEPTYFAHAPARSRQGEILAQPRPLLLTLEHLFTDTGSRFGSQYRAAPSLSHFAALYVCRKR